MTHPLLVALAPLLERIGATVIPADELTDADVPLVWEGETVAGVRLGAPAGTTSTAAGTATVADLPALLQGVADELGGPLATLPREQKQTAVRLLEERGAFTYRKAVETVAEALGVTRFTVYNYLNRVRD